MGCCKGESKDIGRILKQIILENDRTIRKLPALLTIPRFLINAMGKSHLDIYLYAPLAPGHQLTTEIRPRNPANPGWRALALAAGSIAVALAVLGVGRATTRGFGRYKLLKYELPEEIPSQIREKLIKVLEYVRGIYEADNPGDSATQVLNSLGALRDLACHVVGLSCERESVKLALLPRLVNPEVLYSELRGPDERVDEILYLLYRIGVAVQKSEWKKVINRDLKEPGPDLHTWPLGLPRHNTNPKQNKSKWTGYFYAPARQLKDCCENFKHAPANALREARMKSPLILFPVPRGVVAVVPRLCYTGEDREQRDMGLLSALLKHKEDNKTTVVLVHSGIHSKKKGVRRIPVEQIIENEEIPRSCEYNVVCPEPESKVQNKDNSHESDPGGIRSHSSTEPITVGESVDVKACKAWLAAVEWVRHILGLERLEQESGSG